MGTQRRCSGLENMKCEEGVRKIWKALKMVVLSAFGVDLQIEIDPQKEKK